MPPTLDEYRLPDMAEMDPLDRADAVGRVIEDARQARVLHDHAATEQAFRDSEVARSRVATIHRRLALLGYMPDWDADGNETELDTVTPVLMAGIKAFQTEAGLEVDGFAGEQETWPALDELVGFETPINLDRWMVGDEAGPVLLRALKTRLIVLGMLEREDADNVAGLLEATNRFRSVAISLGLAERAELMSTFRATYELLFDQDRISDGLADSIGGLRDRYDRLADVRLKAGKSLQQVVERFVSCCTSIELWLLGFEVRPGTLKMDVPRRGDRSYARASYPLYDALNDFYLEAGRAAPDDRLDMAWDWRIYGPFFFDLKRIKDEQGAGEREVSAEDVYSKIVEQDDKNIVTQAWDAIKRVASRIWDGIKRVVRWIASLLKRGFKMIVKATTNLARLAVRFATTAFNTIRDIFRISTETIRYFLQDTVPGSDFDQVAIAKDNDFDYRVFVNAGASHDRVTEMAQQIVYRSELGRIGISIIGKLVGAVVSVLKKSWAVLTGWFGFIMACVKVYRHVKDIAHLVVEYQSLVKPVPAG
ncbi:MAG: peptidoglycan-binding protein [candidate division Zixibacteria bacterium]|nr:peptidoglycan-binding protein [candidate division Zixibacteria bacterium]